MAERLTHKNNFLGNYIKKVNEIGDQLIDTMIFNDNTDWRLGNAHTIYYGNAVDKLAQSEDIMEKYGLEINDIDEILTNYIKEKELAKNNDKELRDTIQKLHTIIEAIGYDRDTWKRACELACNYMCKFVIPCPDIHRKECESFCDLNKADCYKDYFFQQAKKEGENETNISGQD